ncbi:hypothetical protein ABZ802_10900 [Streptomyces sp. NPDC047737]|uniref:hypothetical protein n=1 Tax=unclassified Streptomyces TaxID=2593676 RepID=UPI0033E71296
MPTYEEITQIKLSTLTTAADGWKTMASKFKTLEDLYEDDVQSISKGQLWTGESASISSTNFSVTRNEYDAAQKEAKAMESLLRDAHGQLTELIGRVTSAVAEAEKAGMKVSGQGVASYDFSEVDAKTKYSIQHDPDLPNVERSYTQKIADAVQAVTEYDHDIKVALLQASGADKPGPFGFNAKPVDDVEAVEALNLTEKVRSGDASEKELKQYRDIMNENSKDKHFSEAYIHGLGAKGTLELADKMELAANERGASKADQKLYDSINTSLANTVASGTKDPTSYAYKPFVEGLKDVGTDNMGDNLRPVNGYQTAVTLMQHGNGYGKQFLNDVAEDVIAAEKANPNVWLHHVDSSRPTLENDPLDGLLGIMSKDPDSATYFLDPEAEGNKNDHLKYLLTERKEWPDEYFSGPGAVMDIEDQGKATGLGAAIQAATTGHEPGEKLGEAGPHSEGQARVMHNAIRYLDSEMGGDEFPEDLENLRQPMAKAMADYVADTHIILGGQESDYGGVSGNDSIHGSGDKAHIAVGQGSLIRVMRGISDDAPSYSLLYEAERAYSAEVLADAPDFQGDSRHGASSDWNHRTHQIGTAMGALNGIGADVYQDKEDDKTEWAEDTAEYSAIGANGLIGEIPVVGTVGGALIDSLKYDWTKDVVEEAEQQGKQDSSENYGKGMDGTTRLVDAWGKQRGIKGDGPFNEAKDDAGNGYVIGRDAAEAHL